MNDEIDNDGVPLEDHAFIVRLILGLKQISVHCTL